MLGTVIDVAIGLIFVFLLLSLVVSALQEMVAAIFKLRGKYLLQGISNLLAEDPQKIWCVTWPNFLRRKKPNLSSASPLAQKVVEHPLVRETAPSVTMPSYLPAHDFALALVEVLRDGSKAPLFETVESAVEALPDGPAKQALSAILTESAGDIDAFKARVETWFNDSMDRLSGVYKRFTHYFSFWAALALAALLNVNSIQVARTLWVDDAAREAVVEAAASYAGNAEQEDVPDAADGGTAAGDGDAGDATEPAPQGSPAGTAVQPQAPETAQSPMPPPAEPQQPNQPEPVQENGAPDGQDQPGTEPAETDQELEERITQAQDDVKVAIAAMEALPMPIGWADFGEQWTQVGEDWVRSDPAWRYLLGYGGLLALTLIGWLITALAVSLGAPFWFDLLKTFLNIRASGPKPPANPPFIPSMEVPGTARRPLPNRQPGRGNPDA